MAKNLTDLRFGIQNPLGYESSIWRLWVTGHGDAYLAIRSMAKIEKFSFHQSGICRSAFTNEHGMPLTMTDRAMFKWRRMQTPLIGEGKAARIAVLGFPTDFLSKPSNSNNNDVFWISAAPVGGATYVEFAYTYESQESIEMAFEGTSSRKLLAFTRLPSGEAFFGSSYHADWENKDLNIPGGDNSPDLVFSAVDTFNTSRPIRIRLTSPPVDGNALFLQELGGYAAPRTTSFE